MTRPDRDYDDILSRVLHSTLDPIEPMGDGLAKIQRRIAEPWLKRQVSLLRTETSALGWLILVRCEPFLNWARSGLTAMAAASGRWLWPARSRAAAWTSSGSGRHGGARSRGRSADGPGWLGPTMGWLRPALAVAGAVAIVVAGVFAIQEAQHLAVSPTANTTANHGSGGKPGSHHKGGGALQATGAASPGHHPTHEASTKPDVKGSQATPSPSCSSAPSSSTSPSPSPTTTTSPTPTPTTTSPTTSPTPTSPSPTAPAGGSIGSGNGGETNDVAAVSFGAAGSLHGHVVLGSCGPSPSSSSSGPTTFGSG